MRKKSANTGIKCHYKMFKSGKNWVFMAITTLGVVGGIATTNLHLVSASEVDNTLQIAAPTVTTDSDDATTNDEVDVADSAKATADSSTTDSISASQLTGRTVVHNRTWGSNTWELDNQQVLTVTAGGMGLSMVSSMSRG